MPKKSSDKKRPRLVLLDTHAIIHRAYHALPELTTPKGEPAGAVYGLSTMLMRIAKELSPDYIAACYDLPGPTHRHEVYKEYKAKRPKIDDALVVQLARSRDVLAAFGVPVYEAPGFEADDCIGTIANAAKKDFDIIIASGDMDTMQLVDDAKVRVFTLRKGLQDTVLYDEDAVVARYGFPPERIADYKGFAGDPSDNIIGIPGIGEKTATTLLRKFGSMEGVYKALKKNKEKFAKDSGFSERVVNLLEEHEDEAEFSKVLATIRLDAPVSFKKPERVFTEGIDAPRLTDLFTDLGFRSLIPRVRALKNGSGEPAAEGAAPKKKSEAAEQTTRGLFAAADENAKHPLYKEAAVMLWLTNSDITNPSPEDVLNNTRTKTIEEAHAKLLEEIQKDKLASVFEDIEKPLIPVVERMNARGVLIDAPYLKELSKEYTAELAKLEKKIHRHAGIEFNVGSPKQLGEVLFDRLGLKPKNQKKTSTGQRSTKESELEKLKGEHPIIDDILAYRTLAKLLGTYIDAIPPLLDKESRLHTTFIQSGAATGRMASKDPGLQNIPVKTELGRRIRHAFVATPGFLLAAFDYSQIELRLAAILSGDEKLKEIFRRGEDVHAAVAAAVFNVPVEKVDAEMRRRAKVINFGILYGMGANALKANLEEGGQKVERAEAQAYLNDYFSNFSGLAEYLRKVKADATRKGYTETLFGRRRYFPGIKSSLPFVRAEAERQALNAPMQGTQADIIKLAMVKIDAMLREEYAGEAYLLLQVHDELIFEIKKEKIAELAPRILDHMQSIVPPEKANGVPILSSSAAGPNWGELKKLS
jgi:DNA polymerase-1